MIRQYTQAATTDAVAWQVSEADAYNVTRLDLVFSTAPTSAGSVTVTIDSVAGDAFDRVVQTVSAIGATTMQLNPIVGLVTGDVVLVEYSNPDSVSITGVAVTDVRPMTERGNMQFGNGVVRAPNSNYARYYHFDISATNPGASGATYVSPTSNYRGGQRLDLSTDTLESKADVHSDWDQVSNPVVEARITNMVAGVAPTDIIKAKIVAYYSQPGTSVRSQTVYGERVVGAIPQYTELSYSVELDRNAEDNQILAGDSVDLVINLEADSDIDDVIINDASFYYRTTHVGVELNDV